MQVDCNLYQKNSNFEAPEHRAQLLCSLFTWKWVLWIFYGMVALVAVLLRGSLVDALMHKYINLALDSFLAFAIAIIIFCSWKGTLSSFYLYHSLLSNKTSSKNSSQPCNITRVLNTVSKYLQTNQSDIFIECSWNKLVIRLTAKWIWCCIRFVPSSLSKTSLRICPNSFVQKPKRIINQLMMHAGKQWFYHILVLKILFTSHNSSSCETSANRKEEIPHW